ncbi:MAG: hypothetical protein IPO88_15245 [Nannocystis sp.]|uniref:hypothetical protein n=1 Tax=Nannocystis sp. TaxID=1962667 RepID=UPI0024239AEE|nr:hypothetical protein [Nannocystis sp.]MBK9754824.1 hypothetical protein [Nannocystis sp.]
MLPRIGADQAPSLVLLNKKIDRVDEALREALRAVPDPIQLSAKDPADVARLRQTIIEHVAKEMTEAELFVPYKDHGLIASLHEHALVLRETHEEEDQDRGPRPRSCSRRCAMQLAERVRTAGRLRGAAGG